MRQTNPIRLPRVAAWALLLMIVGAALFFALGSQRTIGPHEAAAVVPAREMLLSGDWVVPRFAVEPRLQKPPLVYWLIAANGWLCGAFTEFTVRLHSALAALALLGLTGLWAFRWYGREAAFGAVLIQVSSVWVLNYGRRAEVDMVLCLLITSALFLIAHQPDEETVSRRRLRWFAIDALLGISFLAKFHFGVAMVLGPAIVFWAIQRRWHRVKDLFNPLGVLVAVACVVVWPLLVWRQLPEALSVWKLETVGRATGDLRSESDPWWSYFPSLVVMTLPWTGILLASIPRSWQQAWRHSDARERFLWTWLLTDFAIAWLSPDKNANYLLPMLLPCTLLASQSFARIVAKAHRGMIGVSTKLAVSGVVAVVGLGVSFAVLVAPLWPQSQRVLQLTSLVLVIALMMSCICFRWRQSMLAGWATIAAVLVVFVAGVGRVMPESDSRLASATFARELRRELPDSPVVLCGVSGLARGLTPVAFYLENPVHRLQTTEEVEQLLIKSQQLLLVTEVDNVPQFRKIADIEVFKAMPSGKTYSERALACIRLCPLNSPVSTANHFFINPVSVEE